MFVRNLTPKVKANTVTPALVSQNDEAVYISWGGSLIRVPQGMSQFEFARELRESM